MVPTTDAHDHSHQATVSERYYRKYTKMLNLDLNNISSFSLIKQLVRAKETTLDVGCGIGYLSRLFENYIGIDTNIHALRIAKKHFPQREFIRASATKLPFKDKSFKYAVSYDCIEHIYDVRSFLLEMTRASETSLIGSIDFCSWYQIITKTVRHDSTHFFEFSQDQLVDLIGTYAKIDRIFFTCGVFSLPKRLNKFLAKYFPEYVLVIIHDMAHEKS